MRISSESYFRSFDSKELFFRTWQPNDINSKKAVIVIHRGHEHSGRLQEIVDGLNLSDTWMFAYDGRGHGKTEGPRGYAPDFSYLVKDLDTFAKFVSQKHGIPMENITVVANSVGAVVASTWVHDYAPRIRAMVLAAPAFRVKLYVPFALPGLRLLNLVKNPAFISSYVKSRMLTHDPVEARRYNEDPLITRDISVNILIGLFDASTRVLAGAGTITTPTMVLSAGKDFVVEVGVQKKFFDALGTSNKYMKIFKNFYHGVFYEKGREEGFKLAGAFIQNAMNSPVDRQDLLQSHKSGSTKDTYDQLMKPASLLKAVNFGMQKLMMSTVGRLSNGVSIGLKTGFDSGLSLDYIYENKARGITPLGRLIDFFYINAVGWRGIRLRKVHMESLLEKSILELHAKNQPIRILDVAGGPGRYLLDIANRHRDKNIQILVRDNVEGNLAHGRKLAQGMNLQNVTYQQADAFAGQSLNGYAPNIVIVSGFFELFGNNDLIRQCVNHIANESAPGATLLYTGQPYHPQQEMIARTLPNRDGEAWVMRLRSQAEQDEIFRAAGFEKQDMQIDPYGIFTVSKARKTDLLQTTSSKQMAAESMTERQLES
ncbi:bifunctional alpha/beta hydrolase/class I SAM-dependent methyltransferase [Bdellovibrio sp. HCB337]|uniref:bifunctional alpha/beta hydrolase/class I SAM-dependent methyltransferase n=1 Tax=Bdellovibrio sp. HCB337 TaxID=3394358 RepID=UPI0039A5300B